MNDEINKDLGIATAYAYAVSKGYTGTEDEFAALMADYADVGERAEAAATAAAASATAAEGSASDSAASATAAEGFAGNASTSAGNASQAAQNASQSASAASGSATAAGQSATAAAGSATTAGNKASEAAQSATGAAASATTAGTAATNAQTAQTAAEAAQTAAETAQGAAEDAAESVEGKAAQIDQNTEDISLLKSHLGAVEIVDTASGAIASFADGADGVPVESLTVSIEPIQDLHGQANPYPAGGGKNLLAPSTDINVYLSTQNVSLSLLSNVSELTINTIGLTSSVGYRFNTSDMAVTLTAGTYSFSTNLTNQSAGNGMFVFDAETTTILARARLEEDGSFTLADTATIRLGVSLSPFTVNGTYWFQLEKGSAATAYAPYSNICPISGRQSVTVMRTGENLFPYKDVETQTKNGVTFTIEKSNGAITNIHMQGTATSAFSFLLSGVTDIWTLFKGTYKMYIGGDRPTITKTFDINIRKSGESQDISTGSNVLTISLTEDTDFGSAYIWVYSGAVLNHNIVPVIVRSGIDTSVKYPITQRQSMNIALGQTVYGGTVDVVSGEMVVDRAMVDMGDLSWTYNPSYQYFYAGLGNLKQVTASRTQNIICTQYQTISDGRTIQSTPDYSIFNVYSIANRVSVKDSRYNDATSLKTALSGVMAVYPLATPLTVQLVGQTITTLKGQNNVWSDADSVTVDYVADTKLYISQLTEPDADMVADANITNGSYFMVGNALFLATANIASGATISPGVNCTRTSLAAALNAINA